MPRRLPGLKFPELIDAYPEEIARVVLNAKPPKRWKYLERRAKQVARRKAGRVGMNELERMFAPPLTE